MDPVKIEKLQAMRRYRSLRRRFLVNLVQYCLSLVCFGLFLSSPLWLPKLLAAVGHFLFVSVPGVGAYLFCPKCFFLLGNAIVAFLVGESRLAPAAGAAGAVVADIYDEYVERSKGGGGGRRIASPAGASGGRDNDVVPEVQRPATDVGFEEEEDHAEEEQEQEQEEEEGYGGDDQGLEMESTQGEEDEEELPDEELNRRIEDFIARVNKQRRLEQLAFGVQIKEG